MHGTVTYLLGNKLRTPLVIYKYIDKRRFDQQDGALDSQPQSTNALYICTQQSWTLSVINRLRSTVEWHYVNVYFAFTIWHCWKENRQQQTPQKGL